jgi:hypothetical protein
MDQYDDSYHLDGGVYDLNNPNDVSLRRNLGYVRTYANRVNLARMTPRGELASTSYCLAYPAASGAEYLVYLPPGGSGNASVEVNLTAPSGTLMVEWFNPRTGNTVAGGTTQGGSSRTFTAPFSGDAVLYIYQPAVPPPTLAISNVTAFALDTQAWVSWSTNVPATSQVSYGISPTLQTSTTETAVYTIAHHVLLSGLAPDTAYRYVARSRDQAGNPAASAPLSFKTAPVSGTPRARLPLVLSP